MQTATAKFMIAEMSAIFSNPSDWEINFCDGASMGYPTTFGGHYKWHSWKGRLFAKDRAIGSGSLGCLSIGCHVRDTSNLSFTLMTWKDQKYYHYSIEKPNLPEDYDILDVFDYLKLSGFDIKLQMSYDCLSFKPIDAWEAHPSVARIPFKDHFSPQKLEEKYNNPRGFYW